MAIKNNYCYLNGKIIPLSQAKVSITDIGLTRGFGISEFIKVYDGNIFLLDEHLRRFFNSAEKIDIVVPTTKKKLAATILKLLKKNGGGNAQIRMILTGGEMIDGLRYNKKKPTFFILIEHSTPISPSLYQNGAKLITFEYQRTFPQIKTTNYQVAVSLQERRIKEKAIEILFVSRGMVREASTSNIFMFKGNDLITPYEGVLMGITRNFVLSLAKPLFHTEERNIRFEELLSANEVFLTASNKEILPITLIDGKVIGNGKVGKNTKHLMRLFKEKIDNLK